MPKVALAFALPDSEPAIQQPRRIDQKWLFTEPVCVHISWWGCCTVRVGLESHDRTEERRVDVRR